MMKTTDIPSSFGSCPVCGIRYTVNDNNAKAFYWSHRNQPATPDQVFSKVCVNIKRTDIDPRLCVNTESKKVDGLGWGESLEEKTIEAWYEDLKQSNQSKL